MLAQGRSTSAAINNAGQFVVVWQRTSYASGDREIMARMFEPTVIASTDAYPVNDGPPGDRCCAAAVRLADGRVVVVWESEDEDGDGDGIFAKVLPREEGE